VCRLDSKFRLVLPADVRNSLGISAENGSVLLELEGNSLSLRKPNGESARARPVSRNALEVF
jgi:DNA-binding transcriptional regulator/RsmH inhibitor MraZ